MKQKKWICILLLALNLAFIWCNSLLPREVSSAFSRLVGAILSLFTSGEGELVEGQGQGVLRKIAHFAEFFTLGMLLYWLANLLRWQNIKKFCLPVALGVAVACIDETIQVFVPGRGPGLRDVGIDSLGVLLGILSLMVIYAIPRHKNKKSIQE